MLIIGSVKYAKIMTILKIWFFVQATIYIFTNLVGQNTHATKEE